jgi:hypothetical protein
MKNVSCNVLSASDATSQNGAQIDSNQLAAASFQALFGDSSAAGTLKIQMSNDIFLESYQPSNFTVSNWTDIPSATATVTAGASAVIMLPEISYRWMRVVFTSSVAGSTTINVQMFALAI